VSGRPSLRTRLVVGAVLWTIGIILVLHYLTPWLVNRHAAPMPVVHFTLLGIVMAGLIVAGLWMARSGMAPLERLRGRLAALRAGRASRVEGEYPSEVQPLVDDLNTLIEDRERRVTRAQAKAADLAHGLKTPLAVLAQEAESARAAGHTELAAILGEQTERMRRQIEFHLAESRAVVSGTAADGRSSVAESVRGLVRALERLHAEPGITMTADVAEDISVRVRRENLDEMLGNLLDNACKWARTRLTVHAVTGSGRVVITVDDDGPGLDPAMRDRVLQRGMRADEAAPGTGLGLAIVRELAEAHGGTIALAASPDGGLRARLELPGAS
jgi:signal transduction histidine kinase